MRIDVVTIFPEYLAPLDLSLIGKARREGLLDLRVHDLREHAHDRHRTVDDSPYGGGAGMVMRPEPWGEALDAVRADARPGTRPVLVVPGPGGTPFTQRRAHELAAEEHLVLACGRYEGIDERVYSYAERAFDGRVEVLSLGDYVLNGGEVAALAVVEAVARLLPGVVGNAASLVEESHEGGLLEYPVYTKPETWRGAGVPPVLRSGDHGAIAAWRHAQRLERTAARRPDLLHAAQVPFTVPDPDAAGDDPASAATLRTATPADVPELWVLALACHAVRAPGAAADQDAVRGSLDEWRTWVLRAGGRLVGAVQARVGTAPTDDGEVCWEIREPLVVPDLAAAGLDLALLDVARRGAPPAARSVVLEVRSPDDERLRRYRRAGFVPGRGAASTSGVVVLHRRRR